MKSCPTRVVFTWASAIAIALWGAVPPAHGQVKLTFDKRPVIEVGNLLTAGIRFKSQVDFREFPDEPDTPSKPLLDLHRTRIGVEGRVIKEFEYQIEAELADSSEPWRDVYIQTRSFRLLQVRAGQRHHNQQGYDAVRPDRRQPGEWMDQREPEYGRQPVG